MGKLVHAVTLVVLVLSTFAKESDRLKQNIVGVRPLVGLTKRSKPALFS